MNRFRSLLFFRTAPSLLVFAGLATTLVAQTAATKPATHTAAGTTHSAGAEHTAVAQGACVKEPTLSSKVPALPAGTSCARHLYTIVLTPPVKLENVSPMEGPALREILKIEEPTSFSLDYIDIKTGTGELAAAHKWYSVQYTGYLADGTKFDSSFDHPDHAPLVVEIDHPHVIPGWYTGFAGMRVGGKRRLFIPYELAYGPANYPAAPQPTVIPGKSELIFDIELVAQSDADPTPKKPEPAAPPVSGASPTGAGTPATPGAAAAPAAPAAPATPPPAPATPSTAPKPPQ